MTQWQTLYTGVSRAAWGYFFLYFDIRLGQLNILPEFGAYLLFLSAIHFLEGQRRDLALLRPLGWLLAAWSGLGWAAELFGAAVDFPVVGIVIGAVQMYFHFQMMTDFAALAQCYQGADQTLDRRLLRCRTLQTLLLTATTILFYLQERLPEVWAAVMVVLAVVYIVAGICLVAALFALRRCFRDPPPEPYTPTWS